MAGCRIVNAAVESAVASIKTISDEYKTLGENFITDLQSQRWKAKQRTHYKTLSTQM